MSGEGDLDRRPSYLVRLRQADTREGQQALFGLVDGSDPSRLQLDRVGSDRVDVIDALTGASVGTVPTGHPVSKMFSEGRFRITRYTVTGNPDRPAHSYISVRVEEVGI